MIRTRALASPRLVRGRARRRAGQGHGQSEAAAAACQAGRSEKSRQGAVRPQAGRRPTTAGALDRLLYARLSCGRRRAADQRQDLAGDAAVAQPQLGTPGAGRLHGAPRREGAEGVELAGTAGRRHDAGARRADAHRSHAAIRSGSTPTSGSPRCRGRRSRARSARRCRRPTWWPSDKKDVDPKIWTPGHFAVIKAAAEDPKVERIFVNAAIKKALCREAGKDRAFLHKVRPWWGHNYHFHVRIGCPAGSPDCKDAGPGGRSRRLRQGSRLLVQPRRAQSAAAEGAAEAAPAAHDGGPAGGVQTGAGRAVKISGLRSGGCWARGSAWL